MWRYKSFLQHWVPTCQLIIILFTDYWTHHYNQYSQSLEGSVIELVNTGLWKFEVYTEGNHYYSELNCSMLGASQTHLWGCGFEVTSAHRDNTVTVTIQLLPRQYTPQVDNSMPETVIVSYYSRQGMNVSKKEGTEDSDCIPLWPMSSTDTFVKYLARNSLSEWWWSYKCFLPYHWPPLFALTIVGKTTCMCVLIGWAM